MDRLSTSGPYTPVGEFQRHRVVPKMQTDREGDDMDVVAEIKLRLRRNGAMSIEGSLGDRQFALHLLENAIDAIKRQVPKTELVVPGRDVGAPDYHPYIEGRTA